MIRTLLFLILWICGLLVGTGCSPEQLVVEGDVVVKSEVDLDQLRDCTRITGSLTVKRAEIARMALPRLEEVGGRLVIQKNQVLTEVSLPALRTVGSAATREVIVERNFALLSLDLGQLEHAADGVIIRHNPRLAQINLGRLKRVGRFGVEVVSNDGIESLDLPMLRSAPRLQIASCYRLQRIGVAKLESVDSLKITANSSLRRLDLVPSPAQQTAKSPSDLGASAKRNAAVIEVRDNFALPTCEAVRLMDRFQPLGRDGQVKKGQVTICGNKADTCAQMGCPLEKITAHEQSERQNL